MSIGGFGGQDIDTSERLREDVRVEACKVGADVVVIGASSSSMGVQGTAVWLFHRRGASGAPRSGGPIILHD